LIIFPSITIKAVFTTQINLERDKLNIWIAYLKLENQYGTPEKLNAVLTRALGNCDGLKVYQRLACEVYEKNEKLEDANATFNLLIKKYNKDKVYNFNLKDCKFMENPWDKFQRQSILMKSNSFKYVQQNDYYWRSSDIDLILDSFIEYKERSVNFRKFIDYS